MSFLDYIFPKRCVNCGSFGSYICADCFSFISFIESGTCFICQKNSITHLTHPVCTNRFGIDGVFSVIAYKGVVKKLIYKFKYDPYLMDLKKALIDLFYEGVIQNELAYKILYQNSVIVPIPLHKARSRKRGYNQSEMLSQGLSEKLEIPILDLLERVKNTKRQVGLSKKEREENIKDAFGVKSSKLKVQSFDIVFLVDDVVTSGATLKEAANVLKRAGVKKVYGLTLAHGQ